MLLSNYVANNYLPLYLFNAISIVRMLQAALFCLFLCVRVQKELC